MSELSTTDPSRLTPDQAAIAFNECFQQIVRESEPDPIRAWARARALNPALHSRMCEASDTADEGSDVALENTLRQNRKEYGAAFQKALQETNGDPIKAHAMAMKNGNLADKLRPKIYAQSA